MAVKNERLYVWSVIPKNGMFDLIETNTKTGIQVLLASYVDEGRAIDIARRLNCGEQP